MDKTRNPSALAGGSYIYRRVHRLICMHVSSKSKAYSIIHMRNKRKHHHNNDDLYFPRSLCMPKIESNWCDDYYDAVISGSLAAFDIISINNWAQCAISYCITIQ